MTDTQKQNYLLQNGWVQRAEKADGTGYSHGHFAANIYTLDAAYNKAVASPDAVPENESELDKAFNAGGFNSNNDPRGFGAFLDTVKF